MYSRFGPAVITELQSYGLVPCKKTIFSYRKGLQYDFKAGIDVVGENL